MLLRLFTWLQEKYDARRRRIDVEILWPACKKTAPNIVAAREMFYIHVMQDMAWWRLGTDEVIRRVEELK